MVDDDGLRGHQERMQALRDLRELHSLGLKDLWIKVNSHLQQQDRTQIWLYEVLRSACASLKNSQTVAGLKR